MFSSNDLVHLVFANEADTYYRSDLLKLDLHRYLWFELHKKYSSVYFLTLTENTFSVKTYGDLKCKAYEPSRKLWKWMGAESEMREFGKWLQKQLTSKWSEPAAFVCSLEDLCKASEQRDWADTLESIAREKGRTGILVLTVPVSVERSKPLFLYSRAFEYLQENSVLDVRTGSLREMYGAIRRNKGESCVFLNTFSRDRVYSILLHAVLEQKGRALSPEDMEAVTEYLVRYLASLELQRDHPLFRSRIPGPYMQFRDLYEQLKDEAVWERLTGRCLKGRDRARDRAENTESVMVTRDKSRYAGRCMTLQIPNGIRRLDTGAERAADILLAIQYELLKPKNRDENEMLSAKAAGFLQRLEEVPHDDLNTYKLVLKALHFCVMWMYVQKPSEEERQVSEIAAYMEEHIHISGQCFQLRRNMELIRQTGASGTFTGLSIQQNQNQLAWLEPALRVYQDFVSASIMNLSMSSFSDHTVKQMEKLKQEIEKYRSAQGAAGREDLSESGRLPDPSPDGGISKDDAEAYTLDYIDYGLTPPN